MSIRCQYNIDDVSGQWSNSMFFTWRSCKWRCCRRNAWRYNRRCRCCWSHTCCYH